MSTVPAPKVRPAAAVTSGLVAVSFIAVGVVAVRDLTVAQGWEKGTTWTGSVVDRLDGLTASGAVLAVGIALIVIGLWWVLLALVPASRSHHATHLDADVWISSNALAAVAVSAAESTTGVAVAEAKVRRKRIVVAVQSDRDDVGPAVETAVTARLAGLSERPVKVTTEKVKHDS